MTKLFKSVEFVHFIQQLCDIFSVMPILKKKRLFQLDLSLVTKPESWLNFDWRYIKIFESSSYIKYVMNVQRQSI